MFLNPKIVAALVLSGGATLSFAAATQPAEPANTAAKILVQQEAAKSSKWQEARAAYLELDKLDPKTYGLTEDQRQFLQNFGNRFKEDDKTYRERLVKLAGLNRQQIRPFVMQALASGDYQIVPDALEMLVLWQDKDALPEVRKLLAADDRMLRAPVLTAYLTLEGGMESDKYIIEQIRGKTLSDLDLPLVTIMKANIPDARRLELLRRARQVIVNAPYALPWSLGHYPGDLATLVVPLMDEENDLRALGVYAEKVARDSLKRFGPQVTRAVRLLVEEVRKPTLNSGELDDAARQILEATAVYDLKIVKGEIAVIAASDHPVIHTAALAAKVRLNGRFDADVQTLIDQLGDKDGMLGQLAYHGLREMRLSDEAQRRPMEAALLKLLGQPGEPAAVQLLAKFGKQDSVNALGGMLNDPSMPRALLAAWALAQLDIPVDKAVPADRATGLRETGLTPPDRNTALRRLAIYGMFHHQIAQQSTGIGFRIAVDAPDVPNGQEVAFYQTTMRLNPGAIRDDKQPIHLPEELLKPFPLSPAEQQFAIRAYRYTMQHGGSSTMGPGLVSINFHQMDVSHVPLLEVIAAEDTDLRAQAINGQKVAHFPQRQLAAQKIASLTGKPAGYTGLDGKVLDSAQVPSEPYAEQNVLIARYALERILVNLPKKAPEGGREWQEIEWRNNYLRHLTDAFGNELQDTMVKEIDARGLKPTFQMLRLDMAWVTK